MKMETDEAEASFEVKFGGGKKRMGSEAVPPAGSMGRAPSQGVRGSEAN